jgi:DNA-binding NarL/FixJ family response regulator
MPGNANSELSESQRRLLELLGAGLSVGEAAERVGLSTRTAERRLAEARTRLGAATNAQALVRRWGRPNESEHKRLSRREREVLALVAAGLRDDEIAAELGIAPSTVASVLRSAMATLGVRNRIQAAAKLAEIT